MRHKKDDMDLFAEETEQRCNPARTDSLFDISGVPQSSWIRLWE